eukprot:11386-Pelagococcus_subviridis.AAC.1
MSRCSGRTNDASAATRAPRKSSAATSSGATANVLGYSFVMRYFSKPSPEASSSSCDAPRHAGWPRNARSVSRRNSWTRAPSASESRATAASSKDAMKPWGVEERRRQRLARAGGGRRERREATGRAGERDRHRAHLDGLHELARARVTHLLEEALERERRRGRGERGVAVRHDVPRRVVERRASGCEGRRTFHPRGWRAGPRPRVGPRAGAETRRRREDGRLKSRSARDAMGGRRDERWRDDGERRGRTPRRDARDGEKFHQRRGCIPKHRRGV